MLAYILFQRKLSKIKRRKKRDEGAIKTALTDAKTKELPIDEISNLENDYGHIQVQYLDEILRLHTEYLIRESNRLIVPYPAANEPGMWERDDEGYVRLTEAGISKLRADIRAEKRIRLERVIMWTPGVVGILGALIGLAAILTGSKLK
ncbi:MAG: hypothetical protein WA851_16630 [Xanthobacteraceae bacterium]